MYKLRDRVKALTTTEGTQDIVLGPSPDRFQSFQSVYVEGEEFLYNINHVEEDEWEVGVGELDSGGLLVRKRVQDGSNGTNKVSFSAGYKEVFVTASAAFLQTRASFGDPTSFGRLASCVSLHQDFGYNDEPLDPRITFSRSGTATYIKNGKLLTAGVDEPVFEDGGLRVWPSVTNLYASNDSLVADSLTGFGMDVSSVASIFEGKEAAFYTTNGERAEPFSFAPVQTLDPAKRYTTSLVVEVITNEMIIAAFQYSTGHYTRWSGNKESLILEEGVEILTRRGPNNGMVLRFSAPTDEEADFVQAVVAIDVGADVIGEQVAVHHYQIEEGITAGPMVWTEGTTETMPADNAVIDGAAFEQMFNPNQGAYVINTRVPDNTGESHWFLFEHSGGFFRVTARSRGRRMVLSNSGFSDAVEFPIPNSEVRVMGFRWANGRMAVYVNGGKVGEVDITHDMSALTEFVASPNQNLKSLTCFATAPTDQEMEALTHA